MRKAALLWLALVAAAIAYVALQASSGLPLRSDLLSLLPDEARDPALQGANEAMTRALARRVVILAGHPQRDAARKAAIAITARLNAGRVLDTTQSAVSSDRLRNLGALYFPFRQGLLAESDRRDLIGGKPDALSERALAQVFGVGTFADSGLLRSDPFLLLPRFLTTLPTPASQLAPDAGMLAVTQNGMTWVAILGTLHGEPFAIDVQEKLITAFDGVTASLTAADPQLKILRTGAVFYAAAGASSAIAEASTLATLGFAGTVLLILWVFRGLRPLASNMIAVGVGLLVGVAACLLLFKEVHAAALLFGTSLLGVAVDYGLQYSTSVFAEEGTPAQRLQRIFPGILLGMLTSVVGYAMLALAPFPGLRQIAVFSVIGLIAAFVTVLVWSPAIEGEARSHRSDKMLQRCETAADIWHGSQSHALKRLLSVLCAAIALAGIARFAADDDIRRLQPRSQDLARQQDEIVRIIGTQIDARYLIVTRPDDETALQAEEALAPILQRLKAEGALAGAQTLAGFVPSASRQRENAELATRHLHGDLRAQHFATLGLPATTATPAPPFAPLTLDQARAANALPFIQDLYLAPGLHAVLLQGVENAATLSAAVAAVPGVRFVDRAADLSFMLGRYRNRALWLTAASALLILAGLAFRYGLRGALQVMTPPLIACALTPLAITALGRPLTFFHAMGLVLILGIGVDYALFFAETTHARRAVTMLGVLLAGITSLLSFGLLLASQVPAMAQIGLTMLIGILISVALSPLALRR